MVLELKILRSIPRRIFNLAELAEDIRNVTFRLMELKPKS